MGSFKINRLVRVAKMCKKLVVTKRTRILLPWKKGGKEKERGSLVAQKGHFAVYTADERRYTIPIAYLNNKIFRKLLKISEEEFGLKGDGPITLPCDAFFVEYLIMMIRQGAARNLEKVLLCQLVPLPATICVSQLLSVENQGTPTPASLQFPDEEILLCQVTDVSHFYQSSILGFFMMVVGIEFH